jgi:hypothetical protein
MGVPSEQTGIGGETPAERLARWTSIDAAIGLAAEGEQLRAQLVERQAEIDDLRARLAQLTSRVGQVEAENADLRGIPGSARVARLARRVYRGVYHRIYRRARSAAARLLRR